jgi:hypothetical protein
MLREFWQGLKEGADKELARSPFLYSALWVAFILFLILERRPC